jgi:hypothetical protein
LLGPIVAEYQGLIEAEVKADEKKLYTYDQFINSFSQGGSGGWSGTPALKKFINERRRFLLSHPEINKKSPRVRWVRQEKPPIADEPVRITAKIDFEDGIEQVIMNYASTTGRSSGAVFRSVSMSDDGPPLDSRAGDGIYTTIVPASSAGTTVHFYVEVWAGRSSDTVVFEPKRTEWGASTYRLSAIHAESPPIVINELMALNSRSVPDPQGEYDDWIELYNPGKKEVDLSGMFLSDREDNPKKWMFPHGTTISPGGFLILWADEDESDKPGLHLNFKLSGNGERMTLIDADERGNRVLDSVEFGPQRQDVSFGRSPDGTGDFRVMLATPGRRNRR